MTDHKPTVVLVHGAFAESAGWNGVVAAAAERRRSMPSQWPTRCAASPATRPTSRASTPARQAGRPRRTLLRRASVITEADAGNDRVLGWSTLPGSRPMPATPRSAARRFPGNTLGQALTANPVTTGGQEFANRPDASTTVRRGHPGAAVMRDSAPGHPRRALTAGLPTHDPA